MCTESSPYTPIYTLPVHDSSVKLGKYNKPSSWGQGAWGAWISSKPTRPAPLLTEPPLALGSLLRGWGVLAPRSGDEKRRLNSHGTLFLGPNATPTARERDAPQAERPAQASPVLLRHVLVVNVPADVSVRGADALAPDVLRALGGKHITGVPQGRVPPDAQRYAARVLPGGAVSAPDLSLPPSSARNDFCRKDMPSQGPQDGLSRWQTSHRKLSSTCRVLGVGARGPLPLAHPWVCTSVQQSWRWIICHRRPLLAPLKEATT